MLLTFTKMQGAGNDYLFFDCFDREIEQPGQLSVRLSARAQSVGADGIILVLPPQSQENDGRMRIFNADGSEAEMCGNGIRCLAKFLYEERGIQKEHLRIETLGGMREVDVLVREGKVQSARVSMGQADFRLSAVTHTPDAQEMLDRPVRIANTALRLTALSVGNPHAVSFYEDIETLNLAVLGSSIENYPLFSERINAEFVRVNSDTSLDVRIWERGSGETLACGTGATAAAAAAVKLSICKEGTPISVRVRGGVLSVEVTKEGLYLTGPCEKVYRGEIEL